MSDCKKKILILAPHFDDEVLSFGGLICKSVETGHDVRVIIFSPGGPKSNVPKDIRIAEFEQVMEYLGVSEYAYLDYPDGAFDTIPNCDITGTIDNLMDNYKPDEVYCTADSEHSDHHQLYRAFMGAMRLKAGHMPKLAAFGEYPFLSGSYINQYGGKIYNPLSDKVFKKKLRAFELYKSQYKPSPSPLNVDGVRILAETRGMECGHKYAELYYQLKYIRS